jgi:hypothetical protein
MKVIKDRIKHWTEETDCAQCAWPIVDNDQYYMIEGQEENGFCSKSCLNIYHQERGINARF